MSEPPKRTQRGVRKKPQPRARRATQSIVDSRRKRVVKIVTSLPEAAVVACGQGHLSLEVRGKRFGYFLVDHHGDGRVALNLKAARGMQKSMATKAPARFHIPKYVGRHGWIGLWLDAPAVDWREVESFIKGAYRLTASPRLMV
jgi:hypothetical protein